MIFAVLLFAGMFIKKEVTNWTALLMLGCLVYLLLSLKKVYGHSWPKTIGRFILVSVPYSIVFIVLLAMGSLIGIFNI